MKRYKTIFKIEPQEKEKCSNFTLILYFILMFLPIAMIVTFIHESGHVLMALILGRKVFAYHINIFPFILDFSSGYVITAMPSNTTELVLIAIAGSVFELLVGYLFFTIFYKYDLPVFFDLFFFIYSIILILDFMLYVILDLFLFKRGDWYIVSLYAPYLVGFFIAIGLMNVLLFIINFNKISLKLNLGE